LRGSWIRARSDSSKIAFVIGMRLIDVSE
jgi:hypothetical protein